MSTAGLLASERGVKVAEAFCKLYAGFRSNDKALERFQQRLAEFTELLNAEQLEELSQVLEHLDSTAVKYLAAINANLDDILGS
jgi:flagellin-specific chaperone FliS